MRSILPILLALVLLFCACGSRTVSPAPSAVPTPADGGGQDNIERVPEPTGPETEATDMGGQTAELVFESFDGGGPEYEAVLDDPSLASWRVWRAYAKADHEQMTGAGYTVIFSFTGLKPGETRLTVEERSPIAENMDHFYSITVDAALNVTLRYESTRDLDLPEPVQPTPMLALRVGGRVLYAVPAENDAARALIGELSAEPLTLSLRDDEGCAKSGELPWELPRCDETVTTVPGDLTLYLGTQLSIYYDENTWSLTRLASIGGADREGLLDWLGADEVTVELWVEWSE